MISLPPATGVPLSLVLPLLLLSLFLPPPPPHAAATSASAAMAAVSLRAACLFVWLFVFVCVCACLCLTTERRTMLPPVGVDPDCCAAALGAAAVGDAVVSEPLPGVLLCAGCYLGAGAGNDLTGR
jgi:hypothetical protein